MRIEFDLNGRKVALAEQVVRAVRARARAHSGESTQLNDLAVILEGALSDGGPVTLRRAEARTFNRLLREQQEQSAAHPPREREWADGVERER
jgi:hypothetical protein